MSGDIDNPRIWALADLSVGPLDSTAPTNSTDPLDTDFEAVGLIGEDGITGGNDQSVNDHFALGGILVRTTRSKHKSTFKVVVLEDNPVVFGLVNPGSEAETIGGETHRTVKVPTTNRQSFVVETTDGDVFRRRYIPTGEVTDVGDEMVAKDDELAKRELTITVYPDADGVLWHDWSDDPQWETVGS